MRAVLENLAFRRRRSGISRCHAARRASLARIERFGPLAVSQALAAHPASSGLAVGARRAGRPADQANKLWLIFVYGIEARQPVRLTPFFDIIFAKNPGISYSLFKAGRISAALLVTLAASTFCMASGFGGRGAWSGLGLGLIVGGALGNAAIASPMALWRIFTTFTSAPFPGTCLISPMSRSASG